MDFYVTLPSNASMDTHPNNKKSNYTTQFSTPLELDGNYEVALASITCTPNIRNDYGKIIINNFLSKYYPFFPNEGMNKLPSRLLNVKKLDDKINEGQEQIAFIQTFINLYLFSIFSQIKSETNVYNNLLPIFFYLSDLNDSNPNYYIPQGFNLDFDAMVGKEKDNYKIKIENNMAILTREQFYYFVSDNFSLYYYPLIGYTNNFTTLENHLSGLVPYYEKKLNDQSLTHPIFDDYIYLFKKIYTTLKDTRHFTGLITLKAEIHDDQIKFSSNLDLELSADGIIKDLVFKNEKIMMDTYYTLPGNLNLIKYGIIYCDIVQEQIVGEEYRQVLQIIPLNSTEGAQVLSNNLDLQYIPVKSNFISTINISIKSLTGDYIKFDDDFIYTIVKLHFRKIL